MDYHQANPELLRTVFLNRRGHTAMTATRPIDEERRRAAMMMATAIFFTLVFLSGVFLNDWTPGPLMLTICMPMAMWLTAFFFTVVRFLNYLDLRIRHEGWEVELRIRAEAARQASEMVT